MNETVIARLHSSSGKRKHGSATTVVIAKVKATIRGGRSQQLTFRLDPNGTRLLERIGSLNVTISLITRTASGVRLLTTKTITIKAPLTRRHAKHCD